MTQEVREQVEKEALYQYEKINRDLIFNRLKIEQIADELEALVIGLRTHPKLVTPTPEVDGPDYRKGLNLLNSRGEVISLCGELSALEYKLENAAKRKAVLGY